MDKKKREHFKSRLLEEKEKTQENLDGMKEKEEDIGEDLDSELSSADDNHPGDVGTELYMKEQSEGFQEQLEDKINEIDESLKDMEDGIYGYCKNCDKMISEERLEVMPYAKTCLDCSDEE